MAMDELIRAGSKPVMSMKKSLWKMLRIAVFMARRKDLKHRRLLKMVGKNLGRSLLFHHSSVRHEFQLGVKQYEFSCSSSPENPGFHFRKKKQLHHYLPSLSVPCMHPHHVEEEEEEEEMEELNSGRYTAELMKLDLSKDYTTREKLEACQFGGVHEELCCRKEWQIVEEDWRSAHSSSLHNSSRWSIHEDEEVDRRAEKFIAKFYNEMQLERQFSFCQYREMLARGAN